MLLSSPFDLSSTPKRIISLVPSQTELLHYLGLEEETIGITKFCIHPAEWHQAKTRIGGTKTLDIQKIKTLKPDLIIGNNEENVKDQVEELAADFPVWVTDICSLTDSTKMISDVGQLTGKEIEASSLSREIIAKFDDLQSVYNSDPSPAAYLIWKDPYMTVGGDTFISDMLKQAGFINMFSGLSRYPEIDLLRLAEMNCEILFLSSEPFPFKEEHLATIREALPHTKIFLVDGEMFSWYGSRLLEAPAYFTRLRNTVFASNN